MPFRFYRILPVIVIILITSCDTGGSNSNDDAVDPEQICTPHTRVCQENSLYECDEIGSGWLPVTYCGGGCKDGVCADESCQPSCIGKECGPDGCGGSCGSCLEDSLCNADQTCISEFNFAYQVCMEFEDTFNLCFQEDPAGVSCVVACDYLKDMCSLFYCSELDWYIHCKDDPMTPTTVPQCMEFICLFQALEFTEDTSYCPD